MSKNELVVSLDAAAIILEDFVTMSTKWYNFTSVGNHGTPHYKYNLNNV